MVLNLLLSLQSSFPPNCYFTCSQLQPTSVSVSATVSVFTPWQSGHETSTSSPKQITGIKILTRNVVIFDDFVGKMEKTFMLNTRNNF